MRRFDGAETGRDRCISGGVEDSGIPAKGVSCAAGAGGPSVILWRSVAACDEKAEVGKCELVGRIRRRSGRGWCGRA
jgi:hypothetical protein